VPLDRERTATVAVVEDRDERIASPRTILYAGLVAFVLAWILGPATLRSLVPLWAVFLLALGLELAYFAGAFRSLPARQPDRGPQAHDRRRFGYPAEPDHEPGEEPEGEYDDTLPAPPRRRVRALLVGVATIAALAGLAWIAEGRTGWDGLDRETRVAAMERFSDEASVVAEKPVTVRCDVSGEFVGVVQHADGAAAVGGDTAYLTPAICHTLYRLAFDGEVAASRTGRAISVLAHEAWHMRGVADEGETVCYALQSGVELGRRLGLSEGRARQLMRQQLTENALRSGTNFEYRVPPECRDGGRLDLAADDSRFP
jgi:hypothetical protein